MGLIQDLAKRMQGVDALVPLRWRVPFRYRAQRMVGALEPEMTLLPRLVPHDKLAVDIGGNRGTYAYALSKLARQVVSFEPVPACTRLLTAWSRHTPNVVIHECGLGDREDTLLLHVPRLNGSLTTTRASFSRVEGEGVDLSVPIRTLDQFALQDVGFVKIDVEGFEFATLQGARATLERWSPNLLVEIDAQAQSAEDFARTFDFLHELGFDAHYLEDEALHPCDASVQAKDPAVTNYVFLPRS
jgi:FkbM family methyltransferase